MTRPRVLLLGGTGEAVALADVLCRDRFAVTTSLAGRTREPAPVAGETRTGGFGGPAGLAEALVAGGFDALVDATHPFAETISRNAAEAAERAGVPRVVLVRPAWERLAGDDWRSVGGMAEAVTALPPGSRALVALGRQHIAPFLARDDLRLVIRSIEPIGVEPLPSHVTHIAARPSRDAAREADTMRAHAVTHVVSRNSGGAGAYAKIAAARTLGLPVVMIDRPTPPPGPTVADVETARRWLAERLRLTPPR